MFDTPMCLQGGKEYLMRAHFGLPSVEKEEEEGRPPIGVKFEIPYFTVSGIQVREAGRVALLLDFCGFSSLPSRLSGHCCSLAWVSSLSTDYFVPPSSPLAHSLGSLSHPQAVHHSLGLCHPVLPKLPCPFPYTMLSLSHCPGPPSLPPLPLPMPHLCPKPRHIIIPSLCHLILPNCVTYIPLAPASPLPQALATSFPSLPGPIHEDYREKWLSGPALGPLHHPEWW